MAIVSISASTVTATLVTQNRANGLDQVKLEATLVDESDVPCVGALVVFHLAPAQGEDILTYASGTSATTDADGIASATFTSQDAGIRLVTISVDGGLELPDTLSAKFELVKANFNKGYASRDPFGNTGQLTSAITLSGQEIDIVADANNSGAITEVTWNGKQLINSLDKSRMMQFKWGLDNFNTTDFAQLNEAGAISEAWGDSSSSRFVGNQFNVREFLTQTFTSYETPITYDGSTLTCSGNLSSKRVMMDFLGNPNIFLMKTRVDQFSSTKHGSQTWAMSLGLSEDLNKFFTYEPNEAGTNVPVELFSGSSQGAAVTTFTGGIILTTTAEDYAVGIFRTPLISGHTFSSVVIKPGSLEGTDPKFTNNYAQLIDYEISSDGTAVGNQHAERYLCAGTLADVTAAFDELRTYIANRFGAVVGGGGSGVIAAIQVLSAPASVDMNTVFSVVLTALDDTGTIVSDYNQSITVEDLGNNAELLGTKTILFASGVATYSDLQFTAPGTRTLRFTSGIFITQRNIEANNPAPLISSINPTSVSSAQTTDQIMDVVGTNFLVGSEVLFNGLPLTTQFVTTSDLRALLTADRFTTGSYNIQVRNPAPGGGTSAPVTFEVTDGDAPNITDLDVSIIGEDVTITWTTDEGSITSLEWGAENTLGTTVLDSNFVFNHQVDLVGLVEGDYFFQITTQDVDLNTFVDEVRTFNTNDITAPVVTLLNVSEITSNSALIEWETVGDPSNTYVTYSVGGGTETTIGTDFPVTSHAITLTGLTELTAYDFTVSSTDPSNNTGTDTGSFGTPSAGSGSPPVITDGPTESDITATSAKITWRTDIESSSVVIYGTSFPLQFSTFGAGDTIGHVVTLTGLQPETTYNYVVQSASPTGETVSSDPATFTTLPTASGSLDPLIPGEVLVTLEHRVMESYVSGSLDFTFIHAVVPLRQQDDLNLRWKVSGGFTCQRETVSYKPNGTDINAVEIIFPYLYPTGLDIGDYIQIDIEATSDANPSTFVPAAVGSVTATLTGPASGAGTDHTVDLTNAANVRVDSTGAWCSRVRYHNRLNDGVKDTLGVFTYLTQYKDQDWAMMRTFWHNSYVDRKVPLAGEPVDVGPNATYDYDVVGKVYFDELIVDSSASIYEVNPRFEKYCMENVSGTELKLVTYTGSPNETIRGDLVNRSFSGTKSELWINGAHRFEHMILHNPSAAPANDTTSEYRVGAANYQNMAYTVSGRNDGNNARWWGPAYMRTFDMPDDFQAQSNYNISLGSFFEEISDGETGRIGYDRFRAHGAAVSMRATLQENDIPSGATKTYLHKMGSWLKFWTTGCWTPGYTTKGTDGGKYMMQLYEVPGPGLAEGNSYYFDQVAERNWFTIFDTNGEILAPADFISAHGAVPFRLTNNSTSLRTLGVPIFWNTTSSKHFYDQVNSHNTGNCDYEAASGTLYFNSNMTPIASTHLQRLLRPLLCVVNSYNCPVYKDQLKIQANVNLYSEDTISSTTVSSPTEVPTNSWASGASAPGTLKEYHDHFTTATNNGIQVANKSLGWGRVKSWPYVALSLYYMHSDLSDTTPTGANIRNEIETIADSYYSLVMKTMPGGAGFSPPGSINRRWLGTDDLPAAVGASARQDVFSKVYRYSDTGSGMVPVTPFTSSSGSITPKPGQRVETASGFVGDYTYFEPDSVGATEGDVYIYDPEGSFTSPATASVLDDRTGATLGTFTITTPTGYPIDLPDRWDHHQYMEAGLNQHAMYCLSTAVLANLDTQKRDDLLVFVYEFARSPIEHPSLYTQQLVYNNVGRVEGGYWKIQTTAGPFAPGFASNSASPDYTLINNNYELAKKPPHYSTEFQTTSLEVSFIWFTQVCGAYAGETLNQEALSLSNSMLREGLKFLIDADQTDFDTKLSSLAGDSSSGTALDSFERSHLWGSWAGEVQYQQALAAAPAGAPTTFGYKYSRFNATERQGIFTVEVSTFENEPATQAVTASVTLVGGTLGLADFTLLDTEVVFAEGDIVQTFRIQIIDNLEVDGDRYYDFGLAITSGSGIISGHNQFRLTVFEDDV